MGKTILKKIGSQIYGWAMSEKRVEWTRRIYHCLLKIVGNKGAYLIDKQKRKYYYAKIRQENRKSVDSESLIFEGEKPLELYKPFISVIVPNYNHEKFLRERLESIYNQSYQNFDVILLDDASQDGSVSILKEYASRYSEKTKLIINEKNSGNVFLQWAKGLENAAGELVWIAESDDYCELNFLEKLVESFKYQSVKIAFAQSFFMKEGRQIWSTQEYLSELPDLDFEKDWIITANDLVQHGFGIHNVIANVSSALIRNFEGISSKLLQLSADMKLSGDWIFYLDIIRGGTVSYTTQTVNYYRIHDESTSLKVQETEVYYKEFEKISCYIAENYKIKREVFEKVLINLKKHYEEKEHKENSFSVSEYYSIEKILESMQNRKPNIAMACYAMKSGGGEIYPLYLANEMRKKGYNITLINLRIEPTQSEARTMVLPEVPLIDIQDVGYVKSIIEKLGLDLIHSHHASVDEILATVKNSTSVKFAHVVTLHGMYELIDEARSVQIMEEVCKACNKFIYIAEKNKTRFIEHDFYDEKQFVKITNGLPKTVTPKLTRQELGVSEDNFVITLASRAIPEKGWEQAIMAVEELNRRYSKKIVLFLLGEGEERTKWLFKESYSIRLPGNCDCVSVYFALSDLSILPSVYKGESVPLVVIESILVGTPVVATDVGEIRMQLLDKDGEYAGDLISVKGNEVNVQDIVKTIARYVEDSAYLEEKSQRTKSAAEKFDFNNIIDKHMKLYEDVLLEEQK